MIKVVFFDIDGTLMSHRTRCIPESTKYAVRRLREKGVHCVVATGRHLCEVEQLPEISTMGFSGFVILNGQLCLDRDKNIIYAAPLAEILKEDVIALFNKRTVPVILYEKERMYINYIDEPLRTNKRSIATGLPPIGYYSGGEVFMATVYVEKAAEKSITKNLEAHQVTRWHPKGINILDREGGKVEGIKQFMNIYNIKQEETMAFGDGENDIDMLRFAGTGVAMRNAEEIIKGSADYVTEDVDDCGIYCALKKLGVI